MQTEPSSQSLSQKLNFSYSTQKIRESYENFSNTFFNFGQNNSKKVKKSSKTGHERKVFINNFVI